MNVILVWWPHTLISRGYYRVSSQIYWWKLWWISILTYTISSKFHFLFQAVTISNLCHFSLASPFSRPLGDVSSFFSSIFKISGQLYIRCSSENGHGYFFSSAGEALTWYYENEAVSPCSATIASLSVSAASIWQSALRSVFAHHLMPIGGVSAVTN